MTNQDISTVKIGFTGDFCPWRRMEDVFKIGEWKNSFAGIKSFFDNNDLNIIDLECPLVNGGTPITKTGPHIKSEPGTAAMLNYLNCDLVATANNHFYDYGVEGMKSTWESLAKHNIEWMGSGENLDEASAISYRSINGINFAFINIAENEWSTTNGHKPGVNPLDPVTNFNSIQTAKSNADFVIVIAHGGHEHYNLPSPRIKKLFRFFVDSGASAVVGHHTHITSGYEVYKTAPIFYSLGNFCFDWEGMQQKPWNTGMLLQLSFIKGEAPSYNCEWINQNDKSPVIQFLSTEEKQQKEIELQQLNEIIADDEKLRNSFEAYAAGLRSLMLTWIEPYRGSFLPGLHKKKMLPSLMSSPKKRLFTNLIRCEAHRDILLEALADK